LRTHKTVAESAWEGQDSRNSTDLGVRKPGSSPALPLTRNKTSLSLWCLLFKKRGIIFTAQIAVEINRGSKFERILSNYVSSRESFSLVKLSLSFQLIICPSQTWQAGASMWKKADL
jgi:hypothetical protein